MILFTLATLYKRLFFNPSPIITGLFCQLGIGKISFTWNTRSTYKWRFRHPWSFRWQDFLTSMDGYGSAFCTKKSYSTFVTYSVHIILQLNSFPTRTFLIVTTNTHEHTVVLIFQNGINHSIPLYIELKLIHTLFK